MANDVMKLLNKKNKLTGAEVGNLVLKQTVYQLANKTDKEIFNRAELETASNSITESYEIKAFNKRVAIAGFLDDMTVRGNYADLLIDQKFTVIEAILDKIQLALNFWEEEPLRFSYADYEKYKQDKLEDFLTDENGDRKFSLFEIALDEIKELYEIDTEAQKLIDAFIDKPLSKKEQVFYGNEYKEEKVKDIEVEHIRKLLIEESNYKQAIQYIADNDEENDLFTEQPTKKKPYDKADLIYDLMAYWDTSDKSEKTFKEIITEYKDIVTYALKKANEKYFKGKLAKVKLEDTYNKFYTLRELQDTYGYSFIGEALGDKPILLTQFGIEETIYDREKVETSFLKKILTKDTFLIPVTALEETIVFMKNLNIIFDLLAENTGLEDIKQLKFNTDNYKEKLDMTYRTLAREYLHLKLTDVAEAETDFLRTVFKNIGNLIIKDEVATEKRINKARELLNSSKDFKDYKTEFFYTVLGKIGA